MTRVHFSSRSIQSLAFLLMISAAPSTASAASFSNQRVTRSAPPASGCTTPEAADSFLTSEQRVYLWFNAAVTTDDQLSNQWIQPNGQVAASGQWGRVSGSYCFIGASLYIGGLPSSAMGRWEARVSNNGVFLFSVYFVMRDGGPAVVVSSGAAQKPVDVRDYDGTYSGVLGTGSVAYTTLFRDNEDGGAAAGCNGEGCGRHPAVDIPVSWDTRVHAFADGVIATEDLAGSAQNLQGGYNSGWGGLVVIRHDSIPGTNEAVYSIYAHLNRFEPGLYLGKPVKKNDLVGYSGGTGAWAGRSTGNHLHFQLNRRTQNSAGPSSSGSATISVPWFPSLVDLNQRDGDDRVDQYTYNPIRFIQNVGALAPSLNRVAPTSVPIGVAASLTLDGANFDAQGAKVVVVTPSGAFVGYAAVVTRSASEILAQVVLNNSGDYLVGVRNSDGRVSSYARVTAGNGAPTDLDDQARQDMTRRASQDPRFGAADVSTFGKVRNWTSEFEIRWMSFAVSGGRFTWFSQATDKAAHSNRYVCFRDPDSGNWTNWEPVR